MQLLAAVYLASPIAYSLLLLGSIFVAVRPDAAISKFPGMRTTTLRIGGICGVIRIGLLILSDSHRNPLSMSPLGLSNTSMAGSIISGVIIGLIAIPYVLHTFESKLQRPFHKERNSLFTRGAGIAIAVFVGALLFTFGGSGPVAYLKLSGLLCGFSAAFVYLAFLEKRFASTTPVH
jgi:hypothetical protein